MIGREPTICAPKGVTLDARPRQAERLIRTIKEEEVDLSEYEDYHDAIQQIGRFLDDVYTHKRIHSALGYLTPTAFEAQWYAQAGAASVVSAT